DRLILDDGDRRVRVAENVGRLLRAQGLIEGRGACPGEHRRCAGDDELRPVEGPDRHVLPLLQAGVHEERGELVSLLLVRVPGEGNPVVARAVEHRRLVAGTAPRACAREPARYASRCRTFLIAWWAPDVALESLLPLNAASMQRSVTGCC